MKSNKNLSMQIPASLFDVKVGYNNPVYAIGKRMQRHGELQIEYDMKPFLEILIEIRSV